jgi:glutamyl-tRNA reductase
MKQGTAPLALRERVAIDPAHLSEELERLRREVGDCFILSTCNRVELYAVTGHVESGARELRRFLAADQRPPAELPDSSLYLHSHESAARHLFRVSAGLDSMVLGEDQILGQLKDALKAARRAGALGTVLDRLGTAALAVGKRVRSHTGLGRSAASVVSVAMQVAQEHLGGLADKSIVVVGAGRTAAAVLRHLDHLDPGQLAIVNRTLGRSRSLAGRHGVRALPWSELGAAAGDADLLISATAAPGMVIDAEMLRRRRTPCLCLDLAVPRDIDPLAAELPGVTLYDVDQLRPFAEAGRHRREAEIGPASAIVEEGVVQFLEWWHSRRVAPTFSLLRNRADSVLEAELARALGRLPALDRREEAVIRDMAARIVNKLLDAPLRALRHEPDGATLAVALEQLFDLSHADVSHADVDGGRETAAMARA